MEQLEDRCTPSLITYPYPFGSVDLVGTQVIVPDDPDPKTNFSLGSGPLIVLLEDKYDLYSPTDEEKLGLKIFENLGSIKDHIILTNNPQLKPEIPPWQKVTGIIVSDITWRPDIILGESAGYLYNPNVTAEPRFYVEKYIEKGTGQDRTNRVFDHEFGHAGGLGHSENPNSIMYKAIIQMDPEPQFQPEEIPIFLGGIEHFTNFYGIDHASITSVDR